jgi:hypothetical protein
VKGEKQLLDKMLSLLQERGLVKSKGKQRSDSIHIVAKYFPIKSDGQTFIYTGLD